MNEFTKEELETILYGLRVLYKNGWVDDLRCHPYGVHVKVKSMIDNYCEHGNTGSTPEVDYVYHCNDCGQITGVQ